MNTPSGRRGDLRIASLLFAILATIGSAAPASSRSGQSQAYTVRLAIGSSGFEPRRVSVPIGTVRFVVTSTGGDHCFAIPSLDVEKRVRPASPLEVEVVFDKAGDFPFACCVEPEREGERGLILVAPSR